MLCRKCGKKQATFFLSRDALGAGVRLGFCDSCADEAGIFAALQKVESLLHGYGLFPSGETQAFDPEMPVEFAEECGTCGTGLGEFERGFLLGCDQCCHVFGSLLFNYVSLLTPTPRDSRLKPLYPGAPPGSHNDRHRAARFQSILSEQLKNENYSDAERSRSELSKIEKRLSSRLPKLQPAAHAATPADKTFINDFIRLGVTGPEPLAPWRQTRIEIRRNLAGMPFPHRMSPAQRLSVNRHASGILAAGAGRIIDFALLSPLEKLAAEKRHFEKHVSKNCSIFANDNPGRLLLLNDEDHLNFIYSSAETSPAEAVRAARADLALFEKKADIAYSPRFGYLASSPRNMGAAVSVSVLLHLPFSFTQGQVQFHPARADRACVRFEPYCGGGMERHGFFVVSSTVPFNATEEQIAQRVFDFAGTLVSEEMKIREKLAAEENNRLKRLMQQVIEHSRRSYRLCFQDALRLTSFLTIGAALGQIDAGKISLDSVLPELSSPLLMYRDRRGYTTNECETRRADVFAGLVKSWTEHANVSTARIR
jgi:protein-arginine kinase/protein-arginine kinase activator protein McsA